MSSGKRKNKGVKNMGFVEINLPAHHRVESQASTPVEQNNQQSEQQQKDTKFETLVEKYNKKKPKKAPQFRPSHHHGHGRISNWVCVQSTTSSEVLKVLREDAEQKLIPTGKWRYCSKKVWRDYVKSQNQISHEQKNLSNKNSQDSRKNNTKKNNSRKNNIRHKKNENRKNENEKNVNEKNNNTSKNTS
ncbi:MAG: hypothetical protein NZZ41_04675 [Candidatus Dojkabacteria bacterium]|nr:hypothetical protein [Candidatus Dojkabacteria bacterium]